MDVTGMHAVIISSEELLLRVVDGCEDQGVI